MSEVTRILSAAHRGESQAAAELQPLVYAELRKLAAAKMAHERPGQTLETTSFVHQAYLRLVDGENGQRWDNRGHFFAAAAEAMRRILVEQARRRLALKHGGGAVPVALDESAVAAPAPDERLLAVHEALEDLAGRDPEAAALVKLRFFAGLTMTEAA